MQIEIIEMAERKCKFILKDATPGKANALRRTLLSDIPKMAIDDVEFHLGMAGEEDAETNTPLFNEIIAHRLGMVPVPTDYSIFRFRDECICGGEGCPSCDLMYSLNEQGPKTVMSGDLKPLGNADLAVVDPNIPLIELGKGQAVLIYAHAVMGTAKKHVKWQVANGVGYKYMPQIKIEGKIDSPEEIANCCPKKVFEVKGKDLVVADALKCSLCKTCEEATNGAIKVTGDDTAFVFTFETDGSLTAKQVLDKAVEILQTNAKSLYESIEAL